MSSILNNLYRACGALAGVAMIGILVLVMISIIGRLLGFYVRGVDAYAGYAMAAASFLALAYAFGRGDHIRVTLILQKLTGGPRRALEIWCLGVGTLLSGLFAFYSIKMVWWSYTFNDISQSNDATPLWIPETAMALGVSVLFIAFVERLVRVLAGDPIDTGGVDTDQRTE
ncbi:MAG TPA: TRAP transporter small permease subunit [Alphaproteobacteria bacterium]